MLTLGYQKGILRIEMFLWEEFIRRTIDEQAGLKGFKLKETVFLEGFVT